MCAFVLQSPKQSNRNQSAPIGVSRSSLRHILHLDLNFHPFKLETAQKVNPAGPGLRLTFCQTALHLIEHENLFQS